MVLSNVYARQTSICLHLWFSFVIGSASMSDFSVFRFHGFWSTCGYVPINMGYGVYFNCGLKAGERSRARNGHLYHSLRMRNGICERLV